MAASGARGLIEDNSVKGEQRVPYLGNIPLLGLLFKTRNATSTKNNLIMFIRPKILRDQAQAPSRRISVQLHDGSGKEAGHARGRAAAAGRVARQARCAAAAPPPGNPPRHRLARAVADGAGTRATPAAPVPGASPVGATVAPGVARPRRHRGTRRLAPPPQDKP